MPITYTPPETEFADQVVPNVNISYPWLTDWKKHLDLTWSHIPLWARISGYNVYRADTYSIDVGDYHKLNEWPLTALYYRDDGLRLWTGQKVSYRVTAVEQGTGEESSLEKASITMYKPEAQGWDGRQSYFLKEIIRRAFLVVEADGEDCTLCLRKRFGEKCPCFNPLRGSTALPDCPDCYGTGIRGGYNKYVTKVRVRTAPEKFMPERYGLRVQYTPQAWVPTAFPTVLKGDVIFRGNNTGFVVEQVKARQTAAVVTVQLLDIAELESSHPLFKLVGR